MTAEEIVRVEVHALRALWFGLLRFETSEDGATTIVQADPFEDLPVTEER